MLGCLSQCGELEPVTSIKDPLLFVNQPPPAWKHGHGSNIYLYICATSTACNVLLLGRASNQDIQKMSASASLQLRLGATQLKDWDVHRVSGDGFTALIRSISQKQKDREPFYILDLGAVARLMDMWKQALPYVVPYYAVKCNCQPPLITALASLGANFDCASRAEIETVMALGVGAQQIVYANPCKGESHLKYAASVGVNLTTFDSMQEIDKIIMWHKKCDLLLRIKAPNDEKGSWRSLGAKFGALREEVVPLLQHANAAGLRVIGVSFHVGSKVNDPQVYRGAIASARGVFDAAAQLKLPPMHVLDIGGGFQESPTFHEIAAVIKEAINDYFPSSETSEDLKIMAEPGRFFAETAFTLVSNIIGKRVRGEKREYWIDDGIYGSFNLPAYDKSSMMVKPLLGGSEWMNKAKFCSTVFGPMCDSMDMVVAESQLPELHMNDVLVFYNMGAYTASAGTRFNGFDISSISTFLTYVYRP